MNVKPVGFVGALAAFATAIALPAVAAVSSGRYTYPAAGTVFDTKTKLAWQQTPGPMTYSWSDAQAYCSGLGASLGGTGWRLPTLTELETIIDDSRTGPAVDPTAFPGTKPAQFWSSSPVAGQLSSAWTVLFFYGNTDTVVTTTSCYVRCVH